MTTLRRLLAVAALLPGSVATVAAAPVVAAGTAGECRSAEGVTVVVDMTDLGGSVIVRCAGSGGLSGLEALTEAGFSPTGTQRQGLAFVCRINGRPAADEELAVEGDPSYQEQCVDTPPANAYWSYWYATDGGDWKYSSTGPSSRTAIPGGYEGWRFSLNDSDAGAPAPAYDPVTTPVPSESASVSPSRSPKPSPDSSSGASDRATPSPSHGSSRSSTPHATDAASLTGSPSASPTIVTALPEVVADEGGGAGSSLVAVGIIALVAAGGGAIAWRRSRRT